MIQTIDNILIVNAVHVIGSHSERKAPTGSCHFCIF